MQIMLLFWVCKTHTPILNGIVSLDICKKSDGNKAGKCWVLAWFGELKVRFCKIIDVWTLLIQKILVMTHELRLNISYRAVHKILQTKFTISVKWNWIITRLTDIKRKMFILHVKCNFDENFKDLLS